MTASEKQTIFNLLKTIDAWNLGYTRDEFQTEYAFFDDKILSENQKSDFSSSQAESAKSAENSNEITKAKTPITMEELAKKIERCTNCSLARTRNNVVIGQGVQNPKVLVIGEGPGEEEDKQGLPFVGRAGILLDKMLIAIGLDRKSNCYIANIVKCRPPQNRTPFAEEQNACFPFLETQIHLLKPKMILCMGKTAIEKIMNQKISITQNHGNFYDYNGIPVMATYHPSALLRDESLKRPAWNDLKAFKAKLDSLK